MSLLAAGLGLTLGLRHALDPDHVAAVATLLPDGSARARLGRGLALGAWWGLGHAATLALVLGAVSLLRVELPPALSSALELTVSVMLVALGARALVSAWRQGGHGPLALHRHGDAVHTHPTAAPHWHLPGGVALAWRPFLIGSMHGLAGSGGLILLLGTSDRHGASTALFAGAFMAGSVLSMALVTAAGSLALAALSSSWRRAMTALAGFASVAVGVVWAIPQLAALAG